MVIKNGYKKFPSRHACASAERSGTKLKLSLRDIFVKCRRSPKVCAGILFITVLTTTVCSQSIIFIDSGYPFRR